MEKWVTLRRDEPVVTLRQRITNLGSRPVRFLWDVHVAHAVEPGSRVYLPTSSLKVEPPYLGGAGKNVAVCPWPRHIDESGIEHDLSRTPPASDLSEFFWADGLEEGWGATVHPSVGVGLGLAFDPAVFPAADSRGRGAPLRGGGRGGRHSLRVRVAPPGVAACRVGLPRGRPMGLNTASDRGLPTPASPREAAPRAASRVSVVDAATP